MLDNSAQRKHQIQQELFMQTLALNNKGIKAAKEKLEAMETPAYNAAMANIAAMAVL